MAKYDLAWAHHYLGMAFQGKGDLAAAATHFEEALKLRRELVEMDGKNARWRKDLALSHDALGDLASAHKDAAAAIEQTKLQPSFWKNSSVLRQPMEPGETVVCYLQ